MAWIRNNPLVAGAGALLVAAIAIYLAVGVFGIQTLFFDDEVAEANPFEASAGMSGLESDETSEELAAEMNEAMEGEPAEVTSEAEMPDMPEISTVASGMFEGRSHPAVGTANIITDGSQTFIRFEDDFATDNGPDLNVYLSTAPITAESGAFDDDFIDLGDLKGNIGSQNYEIDPSVDLSQYQTVVVWCVRFGVAFGAAPLN